MLIKAVDLILQAKLRDQPEGQAETTTVHKNRLLNWIYILGGLNFVGYLVFAILSHWLTTFVPRGDVTPYKLGFYSNLGRYFSPQVEQSLSGEGLLGQPYNWLGLYFSLLLIFTIVFLCVLVLIYRNRMLLTPGIPKWIFRWSIAFALVCNFASPIIVEDFWFPIAWGRMILAGYNPYYLEVYSRFLSDLPLRHVGTKLVYGPLWALINAGVVGLSAHSALIGAFLLKSVLAGAWIGVLYLIWLMLRKHSLWMQSVGLLIFGWLPISIMEAVVEGHNDIVFAFFIVLWLYLLDAGKNLRASLALAASVLIKYISAPLFVLDFLHYVRHRNGKPSRYLLNFAIALIFIISILGIFYRSPEFFSYFRQTQSWHFLTIREFVRALEILFTGYELPIIRDLFRWFFAVVAIYYLIRYYRTPNDANLRLSTLAIMCGILFSVSSHIWPWYLIWVIGLAALTPRAHLSIWVLGVALVLPFILPVWVMYDDMYPNFKYDTMTFILYSLALAWFWIAPRRWFPAE